MTFLLPLALTIAAAASPAPSQYMTFAGVTLGESATQLVAQMGEPVSRSADGSAYVYVGPGSTREVVRLSGGAVREIELNALQSVDPGAGSAPSLLGITVRDPESKLDALGTVGLIEDRRVASDRLRLYRLDSSTSVAFVTSANVQGVRAMLLVLRGDAAPSDKSVPPLHGGTSFNDAVVLKAPTEAQGVMSEYVWLASHPCSGGTWKPTKQSLVNHNGNPYDVLSVSCSNGSTSRVVYFNIAGFFGSR